MKREMMQGVLPIAESALSGDFLIDSSNSPVWPVRNDCERVLLDRVAQLFDGEIFQASGTAIQDSVPASANALHAEGCVVGIGPEVEYEARLYAHLTGRCYVAASPASELPHGCVPDIVVATFRRLTADFLEYLYSSPRFAIAPGLICAHEDESSALRSIVLTRSAALALASNASTGIRVVDVVPEVSLCGKPWPNHDPQALRDNVSQALHSGADMLIVKTHSDGVCAKLAAQLTLCPMDSPILFGDKSRAPRCSISMYCHRHHTPVDAINDSGVHLFTSDVHARLFIFSTCMGMLPSDGEVDPGWGLARSLQQNATLGGLITPWTMGDTTQAMLTDLIANLENGESVGRALYRANHSQLWRKRGSRFCYFGDPKLTIPARSSEASFGASAIPRPRKKIKTAAAAPNTLSQLTFLRQCLTEQIEKCLPHKDVDEHRRMVLTTATEALQAAMIYERLVCRGVDPEKSQVGIGRQLRTALIRLCSLRGGLFVDNYGRFLKNVKAEKTCRCRVCGGAAQQYRCRFRDISFRARRSTICPRCRIIEDSPENVEIGFSVDSSGVITLCGDTPKEHWSVGVILGSQLRSENVYLEFHFGERSEPPPTLMLPEQWPLGPVFVTVIVLWRGEYVTLHQFAKRPKGRAT